MRLKTNKKETLIPHKKGIKNEKIKKEVQLVDYLPWDYHIERYLIIDSETRIESCIVLQKDGSIQQSYAFRGQDIESFSDGYIASVFEYFNSQLKRLGDGWMISIEAQRYQSHEYPSSNFTNLAAFLVDKEREYDFVMSGEHYESCYYMTFVHKPEKEIKRKAMKLFFKEEEETIIIKDEIENFCKIVENITSVLSSRLIIRPLDVHETICYLHSSVSCKRHRFNVPQSFMYMDSIISGDNLEVASYSKLGDYYIPIISVDDFPLQTYPAILNKLNKLDVEYRWVNRFFPLSKAQALKALEGKQQDAAASRKSSSQLASELAFGYESSLNNHSGVVALSEVEEAQAEVGGDINGLGYYQTSVMVWDKDYRKAKQKMKRVMDVIEECQFGCRSEEISSFSAFLGMVVGNTTANIRRPLITTSNFTHILPFSAIWAGIESNKYMGEVCGVDKPLITCATNYGSIFNLNLNDGDVGHTLIIGPTGSGKSTLLNLIAVSALKYPGIQVFFMDYGLSSLTLTLAVGGTYINPSDGTVCFQPLRDVDKENEYIWGCNFIKTLILLQGITLDAKMNKAIEDAMNALVSFPPNMRTLSHFRLNLEYSDKEGRNILDDALLPYCRNGRFGEIFDADHTSLKESFWVLFEMESLMDMGEECSAPALLFIFHFLEKCFTGRLTFFIMDECWFGLQNKAIASKMKEYLLTLRKKNVFCIFATQNPSAVAASPLASTMIQNCPSQIFLADPKAEKLSDDYLKLGLSEEEIKLLSMCTKKRDYYYKSNLGTRLFQLNLGEIELSLFRGKETKYRDKNGEVKSWESFLNKLVMDSKQQTKRKKYVDVILDTLNVSYKKYLPDIDIGEYIS